MSLRCIIPEILSFIYQNLRRLYHLNIPHSVVIYHAYAGTQHDQHATKYVISSFTHSKGIIIGIQKLKMHHLTMTIPIWG